MKEALLLFPHQLFKNGIAIDQECEIFLIEELLFFKQYKFHKQKIAFHRATMKAYQDYLVHKGQSVRYIEATSDLCDIRLLIPDLISKGL